MKNRVKELREAKHLTQTGLALKVGSTQQTISSDYHHSVHTFWKKNQKADAACIRRNRTNKGSKSGI